MILDLVKLTIDGQEVSVKPGTTVLQAAEQIDIDIPRLCYDPDLSAVGACRLCVVEIEKLKNLPASCVTVATPGMVVHTDTDVVREARQTILELLVANHPLDCMTCEKLGDCKLADYCYEYGVSGSSFSGEKHHYALEDNNSFIVRDLNKCILCGKCIRACAEITGKNILDFSYRGFNTRVAPFGDTTYAESECVFCGNCVAFCPVGALTEKQMSRLGRRWELKKVKTTCTFCGAGCTFDLRVKDGKVVGVTSNPENKVNGRGLCIRGRFGTSDFIHDKNRLESPLVKKNGQAEPVSWDDALQLTADRLKEIKEKYGPDAIGVIVSDRFTNEEAYLMQKIARVVIGTNNVDHYPNPCHNAHYGVDQFCCDTVKDFTGVTQNRCLNNVQGAGDMGALSNALPGYQRIDNPEARSCFEESWGASLPYGPGLNVHEMIDHAIWGDLKALVVLGENPIVAEGNADRVISALEKLEFLVVQDFTPTETSAYADVVLPAASFAETDGTFTNTKRRVQRVRKAIEPLAGQTNWQIMAALSNKMGYAMDYTSPEQIFNEMAKLTPLFSGFTYQELDKVGREWP
jgi:NADH-quinone oxidoreductase subunit G